MRRKKGFYEKIIKRPQDLLLSFIALLLLSPLLVFLAILVKIKLGSPVLFKHTRPGINGRKFRMYKFRTMTNQKNENGELLSDNKRLTKFGKILRSTSLDELPELWNIFVGHMSFVGPRPLLMEYMELYNEQQMQRHEVRPGLSGLAQTKGRNAISWEEKFKLDIKYIRRITFFGDLKIVILTFKKVFVREGINSNIDITMDPFRGNSSGSSKL